MPITKTIEKPATNPLRPTLEAQKASISRAAPGAAQKGVAFLEANPLHLRQNAVAFSVDKL